MSAKGGLRAIVRRPAPDNLTAAALVSAGYPAAGAGMAETTARKLSAVDGCLEILSNSMAKLPSFVMNGITRERIPHEILQLLNVRPNEAMTPAVRKKVLENSRNEGGNSYDWIVRDPRTLKPVELIPVPWRLVTPWRDQRGHIWYTIVHPTTGEPMVLPNEDVCHYKATTTDGLMGISVLKRASEVIAAAGAAQQFEKSYYERGGQPPGILSTEANLDGWAKDKDGKIVRDKDGSPVNRKEIVRREWEKANTGLSNAHRVAILDHSLKYQPIAASNKDAQFVESKEISIRDIARFFGVPLYKLQEGKQAYGSNEQNAIEYVVSTLHPIVTQYEEEQTWKLLLPSELRAGLKIRINMMAELRGDTSSRGAWFHSMIDDGVFCVNDVLALEDMPDVEGGDERRARLDSVPLSIWKQLSIQRNGGENKNEGNA